MRKDTFASRDRVCDCLFESVLSLVFAECRRGSAKCYGMRVKISPHHSCEHSVPLFAQWALTCTRPWTNERVFSKRSNGLLKGLVSKASVNVKWIFWFSLRVVAHIWGWDTHVARLRCPDDVSGDMCEDYVPGCVLKSKSNNYLDHCHHVDLPLPRKIPMIVRESNPERHGEWLET